MSEKVAQEEKNERISESNLLEINSDMNISTDMSTSNTSNGWYNYNDEPPTLCELNLFMKKTLDDNEIVTPKVISEDDNEEFTHLELFKLTKEEIIQLKNETLETRKYMALIRNDLKDIISTNKILKDEISSLRKLNKELKDEITEIRGLNEREKNHYVRAGIPFKFAPDNRAFPFGSNGMLPRGPFVGR